MVCPKCSHENEAGVRFCVQCGQPLVEVPPPPVAPPPAYPPQPPAYPPQQYGYPPPPYGAYPGYRPPEVETGPWILRSLSFIGGVISIIAFFLPWFTTSIIGTGSGASGFDMVRGAFEGLGQLGGANIPAGFYVLIFVTLALFIIPLVALSGVIGALRGNKKGRSNAVVCGITGMILQIGYLVFLILWAGSMSGGFGSFNFSQIFQLLEYGYYVSLAGFLWMMITPAFAPKQS